MRTKNGKSPGLDQVTAEMLKADPHKSCNVLKQLYDAVWQEEMVPSMWKEGIIVKIPKKGEPT